MKSEYKVSEITKSDASKILNEYHYLSSESKGFKSGVNVGLFKNDTLVGVIIFTGLPVPELAVGMFGLGRTEQFGLYELSRLCLVPEIQTSEHNITSWFVSRGVRHLRKNYQTKCILSYADTRFHTGTIYKACNFLYYGLTAKRKDWYVDGVKKSRGKSGEGSWVDRPQKHRYLLVFDKELKTKLKWSCEDYV